mgnify:FL=1
MSKYLTVSEQRDMEIQRRETKRLSNLKYNIKKGQKKNSHLLKNKYFMSDWRGRKLSNVYIVFE